MKGCLKIYLYADNEKACEASIKHLDTIYEDAKGMLAQLIEDFGPGRAWMDADGNIFDSTGTLLVEAEEGEEEEEDDDEEEEEEDEDESTEGLQYVEKDGRFFCTVEGCTANAATKGLKTEKGIVAHIAKAQLEMAKLKRYVVMGRWVCSGGRYVKDLKELHLKAPSLKEARAKARTAFSKQRPSRKHGVGKSCKLKLFLVDY